MRGAVILAAVLAALFAASAALGASASGAGADPAADSNAETNDVHKMEKTENLGTDPATAQAICIIFACYSRIMRHFKMDTLGTDPKFLPKGGSAARSV